MSLRQKCPACANQADNKMKLRIEQVGKGGLPALLLDLNGRETTGVNHPSRLVQLNLCCFLPRWLDLGVSCETKRAHGLRREFLSALVIFALLTVQPAIASPIDDLQHSFLNPPDDSRIMMRWWWFGPAVTKSELEREMRLMKDGGIGGFEVQPVYPLSLDDQTLGIKTLPFLSDEFLEALRFTSDKARELGLRFDLTLGSGWPFGGPTVPIEEAAGRLRYEHVKVQSDTRFVKLPSIGPGEKFIA